MERMVVKFSVQSMFLWELSFYRTKNLVQNVLCTWGSLRAKNSNDQLEEHILPVLYFDPNGP